MSGELAVLETQVSKRVNINFEALNRAGIKYPADYVPENAIKSAMYEIAKVKDKNGVSMVEKAMTNQSTFNSVVNVVNQMLIQGLDMGKKQCYAIAYGEELQLQRSYFGTRTALLRIPEIKDIKAFEYYEDNVPEFEFDVMTMTISRIKAWNPNHKSKELAGAFAVIAKNDGLFEVTNMSIDEIHTSWSQSQNYGKTVWLNTAEEIKAAKDAGFAVKEFKKKDGTKGASYKTDEPNEVQSKFGGEMAKRTVINRAAKLYINSSNAPVEYVRAINETTENEYKEPKPAEPVENIRDYAAEIAEVNSMQDLDTLWKHTIPDEEKAELMDNFKAKRDELFRLQLNAVGKEADDALPENH